MNRWTEHFMDRFYNRSLFNEDIRNYLNILDIIDEI